MEQKEGNGMGRRKTGRGTTGVSSNGAGRKKKLKKKEGRERERKREREKRQQSEGGYQAAAVAGRRCLPLTPGGVTDHDDTGR